jgi:hypothetical protein
MVHSDAKQSTNYLTAAFYGGQAAVFPLGCAHGNPFLIFLSEKTGNPNEK